MKRFLAIGILALGALALAQQPAAAWINSSIGGSFNFGYQSGGNMIHKGGIWRNGQPGEPVPTYSRKHGNGAGQPQYYPSYGYGSMPSYETMPYGSFDMQAIESSYAQPMMPYAPSYAPMPESVYYYYGR